MEATGQISCHRVRPRLLDRRDGAEKGEGTGMGAEESQAQCGGDAQGKVEDGGGGTVQTKLDWVVLSGNCNDCYDRDAVSRAVEYARHSDTRFVDSGWNTVLRSMTSTEHWMHEDGLIIVSPCQQLVNNEGFSNNLFVTTEVVRYFFFMQKEGHRLTQSNRSRSMLQYRNLRSLGGLD